MKQSYINLGKVSVTANGSWNRDVSYERLSIVTDEFTNHTYISKKNVPTGIDISNTKYWQKIGPIGYRDNNIIIISDIDESTEKLKEYNFDQAINSIHQEDRHSGTMVGFYSKINDTNRWLLFQFQDTDINNWNDKSKWNQVPINLGDDNISAYPGDKGKTLEDFINNLKISLGHTGRYLVSITKPHEATGGSNQVNIDLGVVAIDNQGNWILGEDGDNSIIIRGATETEAGVLIPEDKKAINILKNNAVVKITNGTVFADSNNPTNNIIAQLVCIDKNGRQQNIQFKFVPANSNNAGLLTSNQYNILNLLDNNILNNILIGGNDVSLIMGELTNSGYKITVPQLRPNDYNPDEQEYEEITIPNVTSSSNGLMLGSDKLKLDSITLDDNNKIDSSMLPSYVDDVVDIAVVANTLPTDNMAKGDLGFRTTDNRFYLYNTKGVWIDVSLTHPVESGKIYIATKDGNKQYRWSGTTMVQITSGNLVIGTITGTAFDGGRGKAIEDWKNNIKNISVIDGVSVSKQANSISLNISSKNINDGSEGISDIQQIEAATPSSAGVMTSTDKTKLNNISSTFIAQLNNRQILSFTKGSIAQQSANQVNINGGTVTLDNNGNWDFGEDGDNDIIIEAATETGAGVMSAADKVKLNSLNFVAISTTEIDNMFN